MELLSTRTYAAQPEGRFLQMAENLLPSRVVAISFRDDLFDLLRHQCAYGNSVFRGDDLYASNRGLVELYREISSAHARILRGVRKPHPKCACLLREAEFLIDPETTVRHFTIRRSDRHPAVRGGERASRLLPPRRLARRCVVTNGRIEPESADRDADVLGQHLRLPSSPPSGETPAGSRRGRPLSLLGDVAEIPFSS